MRRSRERPGGVWRLVVAMRPWVATRRPRGRPDVGCGVWWSLCGHGLPRATVSVTFSATAAPGSRPVPAVWRPAVGGLRHRDRPDGGGFGARRAARFYAVMAAAPRAAQRSPRALRGPRSTAWRVG